MRLRAYGASDAMSDWDLIAILRNIKQPGLDVCTIEIGHSIDVTVYEVSAFQKLIDDHVIWAIPLFFFPPETFLYSSCKMSDVFQCNLRLPKLKVVT